MHCKACVCLHKLQEWQENPVLLLELYSRVRFAHAPTDANLVNNWSLCCDSRYQPLSTQGGIGPKPHSSSLVPTDLCSWEVIDISPRAEIPKTRSCRGCAALRWWLLANELWLLTGVEYGCEQETSGKGWEQCRCTRARPHPVTEPLTSRWPRCWFLTARMELSQELRDRLLATTALCSLGYGGTTETRP